MQSGTALEKVRLVERATCGVCGSAPDRWTRVRAEPSVVRCGDCGVYFWDRKVADEDVATLFDDYRWTSDYSGFTDSALKAAIAALKEKLAIVESLLGRPVTSMLDVGCGNGLYVRAAKELGVTIAIGTDVDRKNVELGVSQGLDLRHGFFEEMTFDTAFDFVHIKGVLHLVPEPRETFAAASRLMAADGVLYADTTNQGGLASRLRTMLSRKTDRFGQITPPTQIFGFTKAGLSELARRQKFECSRQLTFSYGDRVYYPKLDTSDWDSQYGSVIEGAMRLADRAGMGGFIAAYLLKAEESGRG